MTREGPNGPVDGSPADDPLPEDVVREAERLTRLARAAVDPAERAAYEDDRAGLLAEYGYVARVRDDDTLVCHPGDWLVDGTVRVDRVEDTDRAVEVPLTADAGDDDEWAAVEADNAELVERVTDDYGPVHGANARAFADFMGNHYAARIGTVTPAQVEEFLTEYYPRNAWPSDEQRAAVEASLAALFDVAGVDPAGHDLPDA